MVKKTWNKTAVKTALAFGVGLALLLHLQLVWSDDAKPAVPPADKVEKKASLALDVPDAMEAVTGETTPLPLKIVREGYDGPVTVKLADLPGADKTAEVAIPDGKTDGSYNLVLAGNTKNDVYEVKISAKGGSLEAEGKTVKLTVRDPKPDPSGANSGNRTTLSEPPPTIDTSTIPAVKPEDKPEAKDAAVNKIGETVKAVGDETNILGTEVGKNRAAVNMMWTLITGFLVMFMQAGFALVETGLTRYKNVAHTMAMNFMVYGLGMLGFWICGFAFMFGGYNSAALGGAGFLGGDAHLLTSEWTISLFGKDFGLLGYAGFFLAGRAYDSGILTLFLFQMVFMDTTATIPTGAMAERWKFLPFTIYGFFVAMVIYPVFGNWVWGGGWLSKLGANFGLGHGHVDFAGSSVVHMVGGVTALAGAFIIGPRIGKYNKDGTPNALPAHSVPMYMLGTFILAFGWFGFNPGSTLAGADLNIGRIATNTMLASASGAFMSMVYMWVFYKKPDPSFMCNGMLAGLVAITAPCAFVAPWAAVLIGAVAGVLVVWSCFFFERVCKVDDPVGAISVHGTNGAWGVLSLGLFADGTYGAGWNGTHWYLVNNSLKWFDHVLSTDEIGAMAKGLGVTADKIAETGVTGLFYGNASQFFAECIGVLANFAWVFISAYVFFWIVEKILGNRVKPEVEIQGLDVPEMGVLGYINEDPKTPEGHVAHGGAEPRAAVQPPGGRKRFAVVVEGVGPDDVTAVWETVCKPNGQKPPPDFLAIYPNMTTVSGNRFRFRGGEADQMRAGLERLLKQYPTMKSASVRVEAG